MSEQKSQVDTPEGREWLKTLLKEQEVIVTFTKVNGEERIMTCTLNEAVVPPTVRTETTKPKAEVDSICSVWDVNAKGWRSFRWSNVKRIEFSLGEEDNKESK